MTTRAALLAARDRYAEQFNASLDAYGRKEISEEEMLAALRRCGRQLAEAFYEATKTHNQRDTVLGCQPSFLLGIINDIPEEVTHDRTA